MSRTVADCCLRLGLVLLAASVLLPADRVVAADIYVNNATGQSRNPGTLEQPLDSVNRALRMAGPGDVIHLLPSGAVYREMINLVNKQGITIEGNGCTLSGADPLPDDPQQWELVGADVRRRQVRRNVEDRYILVRDGKANRMGRNKFLRGTVGSQFPPLEALQPGQFRVEPIEGERTAWLYVKGPIDKLEWAVRLQGLATSGRVRDITVRNLNARHALNDGFNFHGDTQNFTLTNVQGYENYDNGISPHGGCSFTVDNGKFRDNGTPAWAQADATETVYRRCEAGGSGHQWEVVFAGGIHRVEDSLIRLNGNQLLFAHWLPRGGARNEIAQAGKDPNVTPDFVLQRTRIVGDAENKGTVKIGAGARLTLEDCTFSNVVFDVDPAAVIRVSNSTVDGRPLESIVPSATSGP